MSGPQMGELTSTLLKCALIISKSIIISSTMGGNIQDKLKALERGIE